MTQSDTDDTSQIFVSHPTQDMIDSYQDTRLTLRRGFISGRVAGLLLKATEIVPVRKVICGDSNIQFGEQILAEDHAVFRFFMREDVLALTQRLMRTDRVASLRCWTSIYEIGQYINEHKDGKGDLQIIICLQAPRQNAGGQLCIDLADGTHKISLAPGDAVFFKATDLQHYTTPLVATGDEICRRVVAIARYTLNARERHE